MFGRNKNKSRKTNVLQEKEISYERQTDLFDPETHQRPITIIGAGNIGSTTAYVLSKMGLKYMTVFDFDKIEAHNLSSQFYPVGSIGKKKVDVLQKVIEQFTSIKINKRGKYTHQPLEGIVVIAVDSMKERKRIFKNIKNSFPPLLVDARMGGDTVEVYSYSDPEEYYDTLEDSVDHVPCSALYISYTSFLCSAIIANQIKRFLKEEPINKNVLFDFATCRTI